MLMFEGIFIVVREQHGIDADDASQLIFCS